MKTKEEILNQMYMSANDLKKLMPGIGICQCRKYIILAREKMKNENFFIPEGKTKLALTKVLAKMFGWK